MCNHVVNFYECDHGCRTSLSLNDDLVATCLLDHGRDAWAVQAQPSPPLKSGFWGRVYKMLKKSAAKQVSSVSNHCFLSSTLFSLLSKVEEDYWRFWTFFTDHWHPWDRCSQSQPYMWNFRIGTFKSEVKSGHYTSLENNSGNLQCYKNWGQFKFNPNFQY